MTRLCVLFIAMTILQLHATAAFSQQNVSISFKNAALVDVIRDVEKQSGMIVVYNSTLLKQFQDVTVNQLDVPAVVAINAALRNTGLECKEVEGSLVISRKQGPNSDRNLPFEVQGVVVDSDDKPIPGASVLVKGTLTGTATDVNGKFRLKVPGAGSILQISFVGKTPQEITVADRKELKIKLGEDVAMVDEVVVTGIFQKAKTSYTGAATVITAAELEQFGNRNLIATIRNIDPAFNIVENNNYGSDPNRLPEVQIRGNSSVPNVDELKDETRVSMNAPLVILDGFESTLQKLLDINENEVESIVILKDASATSIYGSRGANGVVVINTKAPREGKLRITYRGDLNIEVPDLSAYNVLEAREKLMLEKEVGLWDTNSLHILENYNLLLNEINSGVNTYWLSKPLRVGIGHRHNLRAEGGDAKFRYSVSAQYKDTQGVMKKSWKRDFNGTINLTYLYRNIKFSNSFMLGIGNSSASPFGEFSLYVRMNPYYRTHDEAGNIIKKYSRPGGGYVSNYTNPMYNATLNTYNKGENTSFVNNFSIEWTVMSGLVVKGRLGVSKMQGRNDDFKPAEHTDFASYPDEDIFRKGSYIYGTNYGLSLDGSLNVSYSKTFNQKHMLYAGLDYNIRQNESSSYSLGAEGFTNDEFDFLSMALQYAQNGKPSGSESLTRAIGVTGSINYMYDNRYYLDLSGRIDGSSQFGSRRRFAPFWAVGLGWNIHRERFMESVSVIDYLKLRVSTGITGSQNFNAYQAQSAYRYFTDKRYYNWLGATMIALGNEDLRWQQKMNYNLGLEIKMFDNRVSLSCDIYTETTKDLVSSINIPAANGFTSYVENIGKMRNKGFDLKASVFIVRDTERNIVWSVTGAVTHNKNEIVEISPALLDAQKEIEMEEGTNPNFLYKPGYSTKTIWVVPSMGIDPSTGREIYMDRYGNFTYTWDARDQVACGLAEPKYHGNVSTMFRYKDLSLNMSLGFRLGGQLYNNTLIDKVENADYRYNVDERVYNDRWHKPGDVAAFKGLDVTEKTQRSSRFVENERTLTGQNITIQYRLHGKPWMEKAGIENLIFSGSTSDLFHLSTVKRERGISYPFSRQFSFSVSATF